MRRKLSVLLSLLVLTGCAGFQRSCQSWYASNLGANWVVVQYTTEGRPFNCWILRGISVVNEEHSDGIHWLDNGGHIVHISGWYNWVQVSGDDFQNVVEALGTKPESCRTGNYHSVAPKG